MILTFRPIKIWPDGWDPRRSTATGSPFSASYSSTLDLLDRELSHLRASDPVLQVAVDDVDVRLDGQLRASARVDYPGVILSFATRKHGTLSYSCNAYVGWKQNLRAIALGLESLRRVERYGIADRGQQYAGWAELGTGITLGPGMSLHEASVILSTLSDGGDLMVDADTPDVDAVDRAFRLAVKIHHPDNGGNAEAYNKVVEARERLLR